MSSPLFNHPNSREATNELTSVNRLVPPACNYSFWAPSIFPSRCHGCNYFSPQSCFPCFIQSGGLSAPRRLPGCFQAAAAGRSTFIGNNRRKEKCVLPFKENIVGALKMMMCTGQNFSVFDLIIFASLFFFTQQLLSPKYFSLHAETLRLKSCSCRASGRIHLLRLMTAAFSSLLTHLHFHTCFLSIMWSPVKI